jgi:hypothetical protein
MRISSYRQAINSLFHMELFSSQSLYHTQFSWSLFIVFHNIQFTHPPCETLFVLLCNRYYMFHSMPPKVYTVLHHINVIDIKYLHRKHIEKYVGSIHKLVQSARLIIFIEENDGL